MLTECLFSFGKNYSKMFSFFPLPPGRELALITWITALTREGTNQNGYVRIKGYVTI